ncbi:MAG: THUMP domain-containing class I SAM-dependent RNA methyltransferase [Christensenellales bacterium]|jgi:putative N6-adenine-specific DNA methylase
MTHRCFASCAFGLESIVATELKKLGLNHVSIQNARVYFDADEQGIAKANIWLRSADRVYIEIGSFVATTFDALFEGIKGVEWENYIPRDACFPVNADSVKSQLFSVSDIQSISKKAVVTRLMSRYRTNVLPETGHRYDIHIKILCDQVSICLNVSGAGLNRRGYRMANVKAPIRETLAAGLVMLTGWESGEFSDPMCGSGTIAIEAAMIGSNIAPGTGRSFDGEKWHLFKNEWVHERESARQKIKEPCIVLASDIDRNALSAADKNAQAAGVSLRLYHADLRDFKRNNCTVLTNPPYAERLGEKKSVELLYRDMGKALEHVDRKFIITADDQFERFFGARATKKRKLYNGNIRCTLYQYF